jgi:hypothetical protein
LLPAPELQTIRHNFYRKTSIAGSSHEKRRCPTEGNWEARTATNGTAPKLTKRTKKSGSMRPTSVLLIRLSSWIPMHLHKHPYHSHAEAREERHGRPAKQTLRVEQDPTRSWWRISSSPDSNRKRCLSERPPRIAACDRHRQPEGRAGRRARLSIAGAGPVGEPRSSASCPTQLHLGRDTHSASGQLSQALRLPALPRHAVHFRLQLRARDRSFPVHASASDWRR